MEILVKLNFDCQSFLRHYLIPICVSTNLPMFLPNYLKVLHQGSCSIVFYCLPNTHAATSRHQRYARSTKERRERERERERDGRERKGESLFRKCTREKQLKMHYSVQFLLDSVAKAAVSIYSAKKYINRRLTGLYWHR